MNSILFIYIFSLFVITSPNFVFKIPVRSYWISIAIHAAIFACILYFTYDIVNRDVVESAVVNNDSEPDDGTVHTIDGQTTVVVEGSKPRVGDRDAVAENTADIAKLEDKVDQGVIDSANEVLQSARMFADNAAASADNAANYAIQAASQMNGASTASYIPVTPTPVTPTTTTPVTPTTTVIDIGRSSRNTKTVQLPHDSMTVSPIPVNKQDPRWPDTFSVTVSGKTLTVKRVDSSGGWGQPLQLSATTSTTPTTTLTPTTTTPTWKQINGRLTQVSIDGNTVCGVNGNRSVYCKDTLTGNDWTQLKGERLKHVSVSDGKLYGVAYNNKIYYSPNTRGDWEKIDNGDTGGLTQVSIDGNTVCGVNTTDGNKIWCKDNLTGSDWKKLPGSLKHVSVSDGKLYGVNKNNNIWYSPNTKGEWKHIPNGDTGGLEQVDINGTTVCGVNSSDKLYCKDNLTGSDWKEVSSGDAGGLKQVSISGGNLYGVNKDNNIYYGKT